MAESKNNFIKSRMNKDLDDRLIPNGEYRDAFNVSISQAEDQNVGSVSTVLGNIKLTDFGLSSDCAAKIIGVFADETLKSIFVFITNFIDTSPSKLDNFPGDNAICQIWQRNIETNNNTKLVEGKFLNFAVNNPILNINLIEDLLFFTDNRNQPRKINITKANPGSLINPTYYTNEDQISVAKYYPCDPISLLNDYVVSFSITNSGGGTPSDPASYDSLVNKTVPTTTNGNGTGLTVKILNTDSNKNITNLEIVNQGLNYANGDVVNIAPKVGIAQITLQVEEQCTMKDKCSEFLPATASAGNIATLTSGTPYNLSPGSFAQLKPFEGCLVSIENTSQLDITPKGAKITSVSLVAPGPQTQVVISWLPAGEVLNNVNKITAGRNPDYDPNWPGDCEFLKDKFVRFAYRFKFDDNEYSLISPFTQPCFIPKQNGYFLNRDQEEAYETTEVSFFENSVNSIGLKIFCPEFLDSTTNNFSSLNEKMHIEAIEIIYKDDNETSLKVVDTIELKDFINLNQNFLIYDYQSRAPFRVLPEREIVRVSDVVPLRSLTQEVAGNRVIYGNYTDGHTSNSTLNYSVASSEKFDETISTLKKEYQNHTLKQNRTYQVGVVLSDRYGRQSDVILSSLDNSVKTSGGINYYGSTVFHPFYSSGFSSRLVSASGTWGGDCLQIQFNSLIPENTGQLGYPGLFRGTSSTNPISNLYPGQGYTSATNVATTSNGSGLGLTVDFTTFKPNSASYIVTMTVNQPGSGYQNGDVITIVDNSQNQPVLGTDYATFIYKAGQNPNLTGWYSYKIVVKQDEQEYYNVYLPGILNNEINSDGSTSATKATLSLFADNVNKIPQDLTEVGPTQSSFNSNEKLSIRVNNNSSTSNEQFYPGTSTEDVINLSELSNLGFNLNRISQTVRVTASNNDTEIKINGFLNNIQPGSAISGVTAAGGAVTGLTLSDGYYVKAYVSDNTVDSKVILNKGLSNSVAIGDVISFSPPGVVFNSNNNPLIGSLSTTSSIGISADNNFTTILAVAETLPVKSNLNIFYETSTSGKISELNPAIIEGSPVTAIGSITGIQFNLNENAPSGVVSASNTFNPLNLNNQNIVDENAVGEIISVIDGNNNPRPNLFTLVNNNGVFNINKNSGVSFFVGNDSNNTNFLFTIKITLDDVSVFETFQGSISNTQPTFTSAPLLSLNTYVRPKYNGVTSSGVAVSGSAPLLYQFNPNAMSLNSPIQILSGLNGSSDPNLATKDLEWQITSIICIDGANIPPDPVLLAQATGLPPSVFNPNDPDFDQAQADAISQNLLNQYDDYKVFYPLKNGVPDEQARGSDNWKLIQGQQLLTKPYSGSNFYLSPADTISVSGQNLGGQTMSIDSVGLVTPGLTQDQATITVDLDGDPPWWATYLSNIGLGGLVNQAAGALSPPQDVSYNIINFLLFAVFEVKIQLYDGAGQALQDEIVIKVKYV